MTCLSKCKASRAVRGNKACDIFDIEDFRFDVGLFSIMLALSVVTIRRGCSLRVGTVPNMGMQAISSIDSTSTDEEQDIDQD